MEVSLSAVAFRTVNYVRADPLRSVARWNDGTRGAFGREEYLKRDGWMVKTYCRTGR